MATNKKSVGPAQKNPAKAKAKWLFPRATLEQALKVPMALKDNNGGNPWETDEVRKATGTGGGNAWFYLTAASRDYGLTSGTRDTPRIQLEELGRDIVYAPNSETELTLKKQAFLRIEVFNPVKSANILPPAPNVISRFFAIFPAMCVNKHPLIDNLQIYPINHLVINNP